MLVRTAPIAALLASLCFAPACDDQGSVDPSAPQQKGASGMADASAEAVVIDLAFSAEFTASQCFSARQTVQDQLLYTMGQLNGFRGVGRLDRLEVTNLKTSQVAAGCKVTYDARLPVAWGKKNAVPAKLALVLPRDMSYEGLDRFTETYKHECVDGGAHDVDSGSMWYYFRPNNSGCTFADADVVRSSATVSVSPVNTTGKYPEYDKVWEDGALKVVAVFGKFEDGATKNDAGIDAYNAFVTAVKNELRPYGAVSVPAVLPASPGVANPDVSFKATLPDGKIVEVVALMVDNVREGGATFEARYEALSTHADLIVYNGHAGLGANVRALARMGDWVAGQYVVVFINGCDTYAYVDTALNEAHADVNPEDRDGTKHVDIVTNAMPSFFRSMAGATLAMFRGLLAFDEPRTYEKIFASIDSAEVVIVTGEHDNTYVPGGGDSTPVVPTWAGLNERQTLAADQDAYFATPKLPAGKYRFSLSGSGDADLYVRIGDKPSADLYDCRPYLTGSTEVCDVELASASVVHVMVNAYGASSSFTLAGAKR